MQGRTELSSVFHGEKDMNHTDRILRMREVTKLTGISRSSVYNRLSQKSPSYDPSFPKPIQLGNGKIPPVGFSETEVCAWIDSLKSKRDGLVGK